MNRKITDWALAYRACRALWARGDSAWPRRKSSLLLFGCLLLPPLIRADMVTCTQIGPNTIQITEPGLVPGTPEPVNEVNACVLPAGFTAPALGAFFDLMEPNPADPLLPVSDYFDITNLGIVTLTSDPLDIGLPSRPLIATEVPEVGRRSFRGCRPAVSACSKTSSFGTAMTC